MSGHFRSLAPTTFQVFWGNHHANNLCLFYPLSTSIHNREPPTPPTQLHAPVTVSTGTMTVTPYRYYQLARYFVQRWLDHAPPLSSTWKGKGRAAPLLQGAAAFGGPGILQTSLDERRTWNDMVPALAGGVRNHARSPSPPHAPSKRYKPLRPDPNLPGPSQPEIYRFMNDARLRDPAVAKAPREVVVLCHGMSPRVLANVRPIRLFHRNANTPLPISKITLLGIRP